MNELYTLSLKNEQGVWKVKTFAEVYSNFTPEIYYEATQTTPVEPGMVVLLFTGIAIRIDVRDAEGVLLDLGSKYFNESMFLTSYAYTPRKQRMTFQALTLFEIVMFVALRDIAIRMLDEQN